MDLALGTLEEARNIVSFGTGPRRHADWKKIVPSTLPGLLDERAATEVEIRKLEEAVPRLRGRLHSAQRAAERTRGMCLGRPTLRGIGPNGEVLEPEDPVVHAQRELDLATVQHENARTRRARIDDEIAASSLLQQEEIAIAGWIDEHATTFQALHRGFAAEYESCENLLAGLPGQKRHDFGDWTGCSICDVLRKIADDVHGVLQRKESPRRLSLLLSHADVLRDLARIEIASLIRIFGPDSPRRNRERGTKRLDWSPSSQPNVLRFLHAAFELAKSRSDQPKEPIALAGIYAKAKLRGASGTRAKDAVLRLQLVDDDFHLTEKGQTLLGSAKNYRALPR